MFSPNRRKNAGSSYKSYPAFWGFIWKFSLWHYPFSHKHIDFFVLTWYWIWKIINKCSAINIIYNIMPFLVLKYYSVNISGLNHVRINTVECCFNWMVLSRVHFQVCIDHLIPVVEMLWLWIFFRFKPSPGMRRPPKF